MKSLRSIFATVLAVSSLLWGAGNATPTLRRDSGSAVAIRQPSPACSDGATIEGLWLVDQLNVTYTEDESVQPGNATWRITNTLTNTTERLRCPLRSNYRCEISGSPEDDSLRIWLQINIDLATLSINQSLPCGNELPPGSAYAIGTAELYMICDEAMSCRSDDDGGGVANGSVRLVPLPAAAVTPRNPGMPSSFRHSFMTTAKRMRRVVQGARDKEKTEGAMVSG